MTLTSLAASVVPRTGKMASVFSKEEKEKVCYKMVYYTLYLS